VVSKTKQGAETFNADFHRAVEHIIPREKAEALIVGGAEPKLEHVFQVRLPEEALQKAKEYTEAKEALCKKEGKIFYNSDIAAISGLSTSIHKVKLGISSIPYWSWSAFSSGGEPLPQVTALSTGALVITCDKELVLQVRSNKVDFAEGMLSTPSGFIPAEYLAAGLTLTDICNECVRKDLSIFTKIWKQPHFMALLSDKSVSKNNVQALFGVEVDSTSAGIAKHVNSAEHFAKSERLEFVSTEIDELSRYYAENFHRMTPHLKLGILARIYLNYDISWLENLVNETGKRQAFRSQQLP